MPTRRRRKLIHRAPHRARPQPLPAAPRDVARRLKGAPRAAKIGEMLRVLVALGQARDAGSGRFTA